MDQRSWLVRRALLALGLMVGFYALAIGIALALLWVPYAQYVYTDRIYGRVVVFCLGAAGALLWAILPRIDRFEPPGPPLFRENNPRLFNVIDSVAAATGQAPPADVFLVNDVNAWVTYRGGVMGIGSRRVMGIGLPLLQALSVDELTAVLAHEFGHYASGDVALGPWIYKTRTAIGRTLQGLEGRALQKVFSVYGTLFMRLTQAISRQQELLADQTAARVAGAVHLARSLSKSPAVAPAYHGYWEQEVVPVLQAGYLPPITFGFHEFLASDAVARRCHEISAAVRIDEKAGEFDTHPSLRERLAALGFRDDVPADADRTPASGLLGDAEEMAWELLKRSAGQEAIERLRPVEWSDVGRVVYGAHWRQAAATNARLLSRFHSDDLPVTLEAYVAVGMEIAPAASRDEKVGRAIGLLGMGLAVAFLDAGWEADNVIGQPPVLVNRQRPADRIWPFVVVQSRDRDRQNAPSVLWWIHKDRHASVLFLRQCLRTRPVDSARDAPKSRQGAVVEYSHVARVPGA